jgi:hypothetical protein
MKHSENDQQAAAHTKVDAKRESVHANPSNPWHGFPESTRRCAGAKQRMLDFGLEFIS